jgi:putative transposase
VRGIIGRGMERRRIFLNAADREDSASRLNPLRAGVVRDLKEFDRSRWSGHCALMGEVKRPWQETRFVLSFFGSRGATREMYLQFVQQGVGQGRRPELVSGGLIQSLGKGRRC